MFIELSDEFVSVVFGGVIVVESSELAVHESFKCRCWMCGPVWYVEVMIVGFLVFLVCDDSVFDCEC